jgi:L,D-peptidoglycan transpeptidase YkuD (ErfK/YbiS/YcfS/YnhG family)
MRMRLVGVPLVLALVLGGVLATSGSVNNAEIAAADQPFAELVQAIGPLPLPYSGKANQLVTVVASSPAATTATLTAWVRAAGTWKSVIGPVDAFVGSAGVGAASESVSRTPAGAFALTEAFGNLPSNGTRLPYFQADQSDWWVSDTESPVYNTHYHCKPGTCPFNENIGENLRDAGADYNHAVVIDYNRTPVVKGAGSAFFLHVSAGKPTSGCVSIDAGRLDEVMRWLDPAQHPEILIG